VHHGLVASILAFAFGLASCRRDERRETATGVLAEVKSALAERERRLTAFRLEGVIREAGREAPFEAAFRAPNRVRGVLRVGSGRTLSFDGAKLYQLDPDSKTLVTYEPGAGASAALTQLLGAFVPEGFRVPVVDLRAATARRTPHPRGPEAVELSSETRDEQDQSIRVTYVLRWPSGDLLEKRLTAYGRTMTLEVEEEQCDERLELCVPRRFTQKYDGAPGAVTTLSRIELGASVAIQEFTLSAPEGYAARTEKLPSVR
jgi:hypothetical protein